MKLERMTPGMVLHAYGRYGDMRRKTSWPVRVLEVNMVTREVLASRCGNPLFWYPARHATKWRKLSYADAQRAKAEKKAK